MNRLPHLFAVLLSLLTAARSHALEPKLGDIAVRFPIGSTRIVADPVRDRFYAAVPATGNLIVISTVTREIIATIPSGPHAVDLAISPDHNLLYIVDREDIYHTVTVVGLDSLQVQRKYVLPGAPKAIAAGLNNRLYVSVVITADGSQLDAGTPSKIYQLNGLTGEVDYTFHEAPYDNDRLAITPDRKKLLVASTDIEPGKLHSFDVSGATPKTLQANTDAGNSSLQLVVSNTGKYVCVPWGGNTPVYYTANIGVSSSTLAKSGPLAFSADDSLIYHTIFAGIRVAALKDGKFSETEAAVLPADLLVDDVALDRTGSYLAAGQHDELNGQGGEVVLIVTGHGPLEPASLLPVFLGLASNQNNPLSAQVYMPFTYQLTAANLPTLFQATGLPPGLILNPNTGLISGEPTEGGENDIAATASNASGTVTVHIDLETNGGTGNPTAPFITIQALAQATANEPYFESVTAAAMVNTTPISFTASGLPAGLSIDTGTGLISGTTAAAGVYSVNLTATNSAGTGVATLSLFVDPAPPVPPVITSATIAQAAQNEPFSYQITATNAPTSFQVTGLPAGLGLSNTGVISGTPLDAGDFSVTLRATNANGTGSATLQLTVASDLPVVDVMATVPRVIAGSGGAAVLTITRTGDLSARLVVRYSLKGGGINGVDYVFRNGKAKIKPGHNSATVRIVPLTSPSGTRKVKFALVTEPAYQSGIGRAKIRIVPAN